MQVASSEVLAAPTSLFRAGPRTCELVRLEGACRGLAPRRMKWCAGSSLCMSLTVTCKAALSDSWGDLQRDRYWRCDPAS